MSSNYSTLVRRSRIPLGYILGIAYMIFSQLNLTLLAFGAPIALVGLLLRTWASGHLDKNNQLATSGPYAYLRNPLYLGTLLLGIGFLVAGETWILGGCFATMIFLVYLPVIRQEETFLASRFRKEFRNYTTEVPIFFPRLKKTRIFGGKFRWALYIRNREYQTALGFLGGLIFLFVKYALR